MVGSGVLGPILLIGGPAVTSGILLITIDGSIGSLNVRCSVWGCDDREENGVDWGAGPRKDETIGVAWERIIVGAACFVASVSAGDGGFGCVKRGAGSCSASAER